MATTIKLKSGTGAPSAGDLVVAEPALDLTNKRLYTEDSGGTVIEVGTNPGTDVTFADNRKAIFGAGSDLQIYHDGFHSIIAESGGGSLLIRGDNTYFTNSAATKSYADFIADGAVTLRYNNLAKLATTATGIDVTGTVTADGLTVDGNILVNTSTIPTGLGASNTKLILSNFEDAPEFVAYNSDNVLALGDKIGAYLFGNDDNNATEDHFAGMWAKSSGTTGAMDIHFAAGNSNYENDSPQMTLSSGGNLLVGTTSTDSSTVGARLYGTTAPGAAAFTRDGSHALVVNRLTSDGDIAQFRKGNTTVGTIGTNSSRLTIGNGDTGLLIAGDLDNITPFNTSTNASRDAAVDLGNSGVRFKDLYLSGGVVNVNDHGFNAATEASEPALIPYRAGSARDNEGRLGISTHRWKDMYLSGGVYLGGTGSANKLDDYEEGTWTPEIVGSTTAGSYSSTIKIGTYTKVGQIVSVWGYFLGSSGTGAGDLNISGLPFSIASDAVGVIQGNAGLVYPSGTVDACLFASSGTTLHVRCNKSDGTTYSKMAYPTSANYIRFTLSYRTA